MRRILATIALALALQSAAAYGSAPERYGPVLRPGTADAGVMIDGRFVQIEYLRCVPALRAGHARYWEDGSVSC